MERDTARRRLLAASLMCLATDDWWSGSDWEQHVVAAAHAVLAGAVPVLADYPLSFRIDCGGMRSGRLVDASYQRAFALRRCSLDDAVDALLQEGQLPREVMVGMLERTDTGALVRVLPEANGYVDDGRLHVVDLSGARHAPGTSSPIGESTPFRPARQLPADRIRWQAECWDQDDLARLGARAPDVRALWMATDAFDGDVLAALPALPALSLFMHCHCSLAGDLLAPFVRFPLLAELSLGLTRPAAVALTSTTVLPGLRGLTLQGIPEGPWGSDSLAAATPHLRGLTLVADGDLWLTGPFPGGIRTVSLQADRLTGAPALPSRLDTLSLRVRQPSAALDAVLAGLGRVDVVHLGGTPVGDALAESLPGRLGCAYLGLVGCGVSDAALARIRTAHPGLRLHPRPPTDPPLTGPSGARR